MELFFQLLAAGVVLFICFLFLLRNWRSILQALATVAVLGVGLGVLFVIFAFFLLIGLTMYEGYKTKQCQTVHERLAKAQAAPDDYFGKTLRADADAEQTSCTELAARLAKA